MQRARWREARAQEVSGKVLNFISALAGVEVSLLFRWNICDSFSACSSCRIYVTVSLFTGTRMCMDRIFDGIPPSTGTSSSLSMG